MTKYTTKIQYVSWNDQIEGSSKKADIKKIKLENQGYNLISTSTQGLFSGLMVYENPNYKTNKKG
tara:strand:- start:343 stop:537 length:195 start_codon:yes stop_codon:yes gene_type:complete